ncbi:MULTISPECIES: N,N-dimethylformamidase beta subunit family domain-containing protein [Streptomyces]|uniref:N,N-dimethylformamidase beta subunit-like C-terminal domain-containing protein n=1 Tax=Streptomyces sudanensis TaxID=436397 RepID=A0ABY4TLC1_9ACTN|nr:MULTISPECIES: N,N-dimethylformamidase beta subunit family domain-containing protein [Streptomyces]URN18503.1 hypothetical protein MW084_23975 [Streptomyces sudanensis]
MRRTPRTGDNPVVRENGLSGSREWEMRAAGIRPANDRDGQIQGYASATSVGPGESVDFHVSVRGSDHFTVAVHRLGHYGGAGARRLVTSPRLRGTARPIPAEKPGSRLLDCAWPVSWTLEIPRTWVSGMFLAVFTSEDGHRSYTPFVVRDLARPADILMVAPFTTYQAYNMWPRDGRTGRNLYRGYKSEGKTGGSPERAYEVSFDRPYANTGLPTLYEMDTGFTRWAEQSGYDITYASGVDLHEGRIDPARYSAIVFPGHDEYWSKEMRDHAEAALAAGTHIAFLGANNLYFNTRLEASRRGRDCRVVACYKEEPDPNPGEGGPTIRWRKLDDDHRRAEQAFLGVQYNGMLKDPVPLVVSAADHWLWKGTGLKEGDGIPDLVSIEADGHDEDMPAPDDAEQVLLSHSPYQDSMGRGLRHQNTSLCTHAHGTLLFAAGTFGWPLALYDPEHADERVRKATANLFARMLGPRGSSAV